MQLIKFRDFLGKGGKSGPPVSIRAADLDANFQSLAIAPDKLGIYQVLMTENGQEISFTANNRSVGWQELTICVNGTPKKMLVLGTDPY